MHSPSPARTRFSFKASHRRMTLKISHAGAVDEAPPTRPHAPARSPARSSDRVVSAPSRERYIAPPKRGRR